jgi:hypothetical protein
MEEWFWAFVQMYKISCNVMFSYNTRLGLTCIAYELEINNGWGSDSPNNEIEQLNDSI